MMDTLVRLVRWGDDFPLSGRSSLCNAFRDGLGKHLLVKTTVVMGSNAEMDDVQEAIHLNRPLRLYPPDTVGGERWELEADPRHVENLVSKVGLSNESKAVSTTGAQTADEEDGKELGAEGRACHRSWTMRASYLSQDRCELQFAVKEFARRMQQPNTKNMQALKRLVRFLMGSPRRLIVYSRQVEQPNVGVFSDSDWAGVCEGPTVDFVFVRDAGWASRCIVGNDSKCGGDKLRRSGVLRVDQECIESSGCSGHGC